MVSDPEFSEGVEADLEESRADDDPDGASPSRIGLGAEVFMAATVTILATVVWFLTLDALPASTPLWVVPVYWLGLCTLPLYVLYHIGVRPRVLVITLVAVGGLGWFLLQLALAMVAEIIGGLLEAFGIG